MSDQERRKVLGVAALLSAAVELQDYGTTDLPDLQPYLVELRASFDRAVLAYAATLDEKKR